MKKNKQIRLSHPLFLILNNSLIDLPTPSNISTWWNFGSLLGMYMLIQITSGLFLSMHYSANIEIAFETMIHICRNVEYGWLIRTIHANGASFFFLCLYLHVGRGIYYNSYMYIQTWMIGIILLFLSMGTAFMGYVLPWGQMSFWGATVITNLLSAVPYIGGNLVQWIWGGFAVDNATLTRFFSFHFIFPFVLMALTMIHLMFLHQTGSNNPMGMNSAIDKIPFHPYFTFKDIMGFVIMLTLFLSLNLYKPYYLGDPDNFIPANPLVTPVHIQPEWYFLFAYAILRSIPNKLGGVIALILSIAILIIMPFSNFNKFKGNNFYPMNKILFWILVITIYLLTWIGARPVEAPYILTGQILSLIYFSFYFMNPMIYKIWDKMIN